MLSSVLPHPEFRPTPKGPRPGELDRAVAHRGGWLYAQAFAAAQPIPIR